MYNKNLSELMDKINYQFKDINLLKNALTHSSYANEKTIKKYKDNERLEFLGDAVLELTSSDYIYKNYSNMNEGQMTRLRASIVCEPTLAICARAIGIDNFIMLVLIFFQTYIIMFILIQLLKLFFTHFNY